MRVSIPEEVLIQDLGGELVLLNLQNEQYFGLDEVGTLAWSALQDNGSTEAAYAAVGAEYEVEAEQLRQDVDELIEQLVKHGLLRVVEE